MNERIKVLEKQATTVVEGWSDESGTTRYYEFNKEKFAELIVRECCQYLNSEAERLYSLSASEHRPNFKEDFEICAEKCYDNIQGLKDHFGVEDE